MLMFYVYTLYEGPKPIYDYVLLYHVLLWKIRKVLFAKVAPNRI